MADPVVPGAHPTLVIARGWQDMSLVTAPIRATMKDHVMRFVIRPADWSRANQKMIVRLQSSTDGLVWVDRVVSEYPAGPVSTPQEYEWCYNYDPPAGLRCRLVCEVHGAITFGVEGGEQPIA